MCGVARRYTVSGFGAIMGDAGEQLADQQEEIQVEADVYF